jgi:anti-anti-sigma factor
MEHIGINSFPSGDTIYLALNGRLVHGEHAAGAVREAIYGSIRQHPRMIKINLERVSKIDAAGIGVLVLGRVTAHAAGVRLELEGLTRQIRDLLVVTKLISVI